jgi:hypothetical protein
MRKTGCIGASTHELTTVYDPECTARTRSVLDTILGSPSIDVVVFATNNNSLRYLGAADAPADELRANIAANLASLVAAGKTVIAIGDVPATLTPAPQCVDLHHLQYVPRGSSPRLRFRLRKFRSSARRGCFSRAQGRARLSVPESPTMAAGSWKFRNAARLSRFHAG